jgi:hypothetical protein
MITTQQQTTDSHVIFWGFYLKAEAGAEEPILDLQVLWRRCLLF